MDCLAGACLVVKRRSAPKLVSGEADRQAALAYESGMHAWREAMVTEVERWTPKYVSLAQRFRKDDPFRTARERMFAVIQSRLRNPDLNGAVTFWMMFTHGVEPSAKESWRIPSHLAPGGVRERLAKLPKQEADKLLRESTLLRIKKSIKPF